MGTLNMIPARILMAVWNTELVIVRARLLFMLMLYGWSQSRGIGVLERYT